MIKFIATILIAVGILMTMSSIQRKGAQQHEALMAHYQAARDTLAVAELAREIYKYRVATDSLPAIVSRDSVPSYSKLPGHPFLGFPERWPDVHLVTVGVPTHLNITPSYAGHGFVLLSAKMSGYRYDYRERRFVPSGSDDEQQSAIYYLPRPLSVPIGMEHLLRR